MLSSFSLQQSDIEKAPWCFYPRDYGYTVTRSTENSTGIALDITRKKTYGSARPDSPDIDNLRVEILYHTGHMLQFKVCACFSTCCIVPVSMCAHTLDSHVPSLTRSGIQPQNVMRFQCLCRYLPRLSLMKTRDFTVSLLPQVLSASRS